MTAIKKNGLLAVGILFLAGALFVGAAALAVTAQGNKGIGSSNAGANTNGYGGMVGSGQIGAGVGTNGMMGGNYGTPTDPNAKRLSGAQVRKAVTDYINTYYQGQNLTIAEIMEFQSNSYAQIREPLAGVNAFELLIDPYTSNVWPEYGPNMMWNTKYGLMAQGAGSLSGGMTGSTAGGMMGGASRSTPPTAAMPVNTQQAVQSAQQYLDTQGTGLTAESQPDTFYGYYTIHMLKDGKIEGMLSVNGYTSQVWYHSWHGPFITMVGGQ